MLPDFLVRFRRVAVFGIHVVLILLGYLVAFGLRFDFDPPTQQLRLYGATVLALLVIRLLSFAVFRLYSGWWRHVGIRDLTAIVKGVSLSTALFLAFLFFNGQLYAFPRSVLALDWLIAVLLFGGTRFSVRIYREERLLEWRGGFTGTPALIVGAGEAAERLIRQFRRDQRAEWNPVALVDDDPAKRGMRIHGVPVLGTTTQIRDVATRLNVALIIIAIPSASRADMQRIVDTCMATGVKFQIVPALGELLDGTARVNQLRNVQIEDLLGRDVVELDLSVIERDLRGKAVLVTGGAGSIGAELARQVARFGPSRLILVEQAESPLYFVHLEISRAHPHLDVAAVIADVTDRPRIEQVFAAHRPDYVFHAAAYKHVPLMEENVGEAVRNNVLGTLCVAECAAKVGAEKFVLISTDKAVRPSSVMGATKRIAERLVLGWGPLRESATDFRAVRFGNVLGSDGSVVPLFRRQLASGGPLTVTAPEATRYFMTIPEAVQLVLQAGALPEAAGRICMLEMGEPVRITDLAENLIRLSGLEPYKGIPIVFTGLRPGEKLHEELMSDVEATIPTAIDKIRVVQTDEADGEQIRGGLEQLAAMASFGCRADLLDAIRALVPECVSPLREHGRASTSATASG